MNVLLVFGEVAQGGGAESWVWRDSCAICLFMAGGVALAVAVYLLRKTPSFQPIRYLRRR